jgi:hypothetical protein
LPPYPHTQEKKKKAGWKLTLRGKQGERKISCSLKLGCCVLLKNTMNVSFSLIFFPLFGEYVIRIALPNKTLSHECQAQ